MGPQSTCTPSGTHTWGTAYNGPGVSGIYGRDTRDVTWSVDSSCTLYLSGGTSPDYYYTGYDDKPWYTYANDDGQNLITRIQIDGNLTLYTDNDSAYYKGIFEDMSNLATVNGNTLHLAGKAAEALFEGDHNLSSISGIYGWDTSKVTDLSRMFYFCDGLTSLDLSSFNTINVISMLHMFDECSNLTSLNVSNFNTTNVTDMGGMFDGCSNLTSLNVSNFNTTNVTDMGEMFRSCSKLTSLNVSNFNTTNVTSMGGMFDWCSNLTSLNLSNFNTTNVTDMGEMFRSCSNLTSLNLSNFNTTNVTSMWHMFDSCDSLTSLNLSNFNTANVIYMGSMFMYCSNLTSLNISNFNTANVTGMYDMFNGCNDLTSLNISNFNTTNVTLMNGMFENCGTLATLDLSSFNTTNVTDMHDMFSGCSNLTTLDVSHFATSNVTNMSSMFLYCYKVVLLDLNGFDTSKATLPNTALDYLPSGLRMLRLGSATRLNTNVFTDINVGIWVRTSSFDTNELPLSTIGGNQSLAAIASSANPAGYYIDNKLMVPNFTITVDPGPGATTSVHSYRVDTSSSDQTITIPSNILTNPAGKIFDGWSSPHPNECRPAAATNSWFYPKNVRGKVTITAKWKAVPAASLSFINNSWSLEPEDSPAGPVKFTIQEGAKTANSERIDVTTGHGGSGSCSLSTSTGNCDVTISASSLEPTPGVQYSATATAAIHDPYTGQWVTRDTSTTQRGYLAYEHLIFSRGTGTGTPPQDIKAPLYVDRSSTRTKASVNIPGQQGLTGPGGDTYLNYWTYTDNIIGVRTIAPGRTDYTIGNEVSRGVLQATLTPHWTQIGTPSYYTNAVHARQGTPTTVDFEYADPMDTGDTGALLSGLSVKMDIDTHRTNGTDGCTLSISTRSCKATGWAADRLTDTTRGAADRYQYHVSLTLTVTNPTTGQRMTRITDKTGTLASMRATFARGTTPAGSVTGDEPATTDDVLVDTLYQTAAIPVPTRGNLRGPNAWFAGWAGPSTTYQPGAQDLPISEATSLDGNVHYTLALAAKWTTMDNPSLDDPIVHAPAGAASTFSVTPYKGRNTPEGWSISVTSATTGTTLVSCTESTASPSGYCIALFHPISDLTSPTPGSTYTITATVTAPNPDDPSDTVTATTTKNGILPYITLRYAKGGGTGTLPAGAQALIDNSGGFNASKAYFDIASPTGLTGPGGAAFTGWQAGGRPWQVGPAQAISKTAGTAGGTGETIVTLTATWSTVAKPSILTATYHHTGNTVTLMGTAMGVGGDTVTACMTDGDGETDTCRTSAANSRPAPEPAPGSAFTPITTGNPRVDTFTVDPNDVGSIAITGHVDRDTTFTGPNATTAHVRVCPAGTPAPTAGAVPADCSEISTFAGGKFIIGANDTVVWNGHARPAPTDNDHTTKDTDFKNGDGYYDIWAYTAFSMNTTSIRQMGTPVKIYSRYHYTATPPAAPTTASWDWSVTFPASDYTSRYGANGQHHFTAHQTSQGANGGAQDLQGTLPWLKTTYDTNMPGGTTATAPDPGKSLIDTTDSSRLSDITLARPTDSMEPADSVFLGWSASASATTPDTGMGDPSSRTVTLSAPAGSPEADTTLHAVWRKLNKPTIDAKGKRDPSSKDATLTGNTTPWTNDEPVEVLIHAMNGQTGSALDTPQTPTVSTSGDYDGATQHGWTLTLPYASLPDKGHYQVSASAVGDDGAWRGVAHRYVKATATQDVTIDDNLVHALPLTGGQRTILIIALTLLGVFLIGMSQLARNRRRWHHQ
ncbi:BspA family leucine-rich repeat surface protein [Bifidobacterium sp. ESL0690]|uniref:BspA family leucine-rich repeat surface protein n=1 Tax=Bifidobacterium sp. ESL0690 TaxID=2983214 RepID=UPI0023F62D8A|nr:BspA family leucine-rich repeat surface protein [Bifidobacterium sp. ESL0690]WEV46726.1 BspA family leucine-rich repeat surface protein [Bifidobacterium sp. ESL0690]